MKIYPQKIQCLAIGVNVQERMSAADSLMSVGRNQATGKPAVKNQLAYMQSLRDSSQKLQRSLDGSLEPQLGTKIVYLLQGILKDPELESVFKSVNKVQTCLEQNIADIPNLSLANVNDFLLSVNKLILSQTYIVLGFEEHIATPPKNSVGLDWPYWTTIPVNQGGISVDGDLWGPRYIHRIDHILKESKAGRPQQITFICPDSQQPHTLNPYIIKQAHLIWEAAANAAEVKSQTYGGLEKALTEIPYMAKISPNSQGKQQDGSIARHVAEEDYKIQYAYIIYHRMFSELDSANIHDKVSSDQGINTAAVNATCGRVVLKQTINRSNGSITPFEFAYLLSIDPLDPKINFVATEQQYNEFQSTLGKIFTDRFNRIDNQ